MIDIFRKTCFNRYFELKIAELHKKKVIGNPIYLSLGTEHIPAVVSSVFKCPIFVQHRCHSWYLSWGGSPKGLLKELMGREDGCNKGRGGSASVSIKEVDFFGHSGLLGDQIPIGTGFAHASGRMTIVVCGDAAVEEDYALATFGYAVSKKVPVLYVVEDNDLSILTKKEVRRSWNVVEVAKGFGLNAFHCEDDPWRIKSSLENLALPALINIRTCRHLWHAGSGCDGEPEWNRFEIFKEQMNAPEIEEEERQKVEELFNE